VFLFTDLVESDAGSGAEALFREPALHTSRNDAARAPDRVVRHDVGIEGDDQRHGAIDGTQGTIERGADTNLTIEADLPTGRADDDRRREVTGNDTNPYRSHDAETTDIDIGVRLAGLVHDVGLGETVDDLDRGTDVKP